MFDRRVAKRFSLQLAFTNKVTMETLNEIQFHDIFNLEDIQRFQDLFSDATGVASIIMHPDGTPITNPSNFRRLFNKITYKTEKGSINCFKSIVEISKQNISGPIIQACICNGLLEAGASINVDGRHIANWLIGQVRNADVEIDQLIQCSEDIGGDRADFIAALNELPVMSVSQFNKISEMLFTFANELSEKAYNNWQLKVQILERKQTELLLKEKNKQIEKQKEEFVLINKELLFQNEEKEKQASELKRNKQFLDETGRMAVVGGWELNLKNNELSWSDIVCQIHEVELDYKPTVELGVSFYTPEAIPVIKKALSEAIMDGKSFDLDLQLITAKQNKIWVRTIGKAYYLNDEIVKIGGMFQNISEYKAVEQELNMANNKLLFHNEEKEKRSAELTIANKELLFHNKEKEKIAAELVIANNELAFQNQEKEKREAELIIAKEKAEESDNLKTSFLNNISHEIRTPFNGILGFLDILQNNDLTDGERAEYTGIVNKSAFRLMNTINDIVEISQIQAGQITPFLKATNLQKLTSDIYSDFKIKAETKGLKFLIAKELPVSVDVFYTDSSKLNSILGILIGNAIKFTETGSINFGVKMIVVNIPEADLKDGRSSVSTLQFSVKDSGIGISKDKHDSIFNRFYQADGSNTRDYEGSGLGLSIAKAYVIMLGGKIWVESDEGKGSEFFFTIPYFEKPQDIVETNEVELTDPSEILVQPLKILIAEDNEISGKLIEIAVKIFGSEVLKAKSGLEVIEICRSNPDIDFILMDIKLKDIDGYEATRQIREFNKNVIIIAQTSYALASHREKALAAGCNDYISKPFNSTMLTSLMNKYINKQPK